VYLGPEYKGPHGEALTPITPRELTVAVTLAVLAVIFGVFPQTVAFQYMDATIDHQVEQMVQWTRDVKEPQLRERALRAESGVAEKAEAAAEHPAAGESLRPVSQLKLEKAAAVR
jgi:NADH-quinone oxidoreductase subunit M